MARAPRSRDAGGAVRSRLIAPSRGRTRYAGVRVWIEAHPDYAVLAGLLLLGLLLRIYFTVAWHPALTGFSDSGIYFQDGVQSVWTDPIRTVGYSMFLRLLHGISPHLVFVVIVQHLLGLATALLLFFTVRRAGGPRWLGLIPAAVIALAGDELFIEHTPLSETVYIFLLAATVYCLVRARGAEPLWPRGAGWAAIAGLAAGLSVWDREQALALIPLFALWIVFSRGRPTRWTLVVGLVSLLTAVATVEGYIQWRHADTGLSGLTTNGDWVLYGRVAPWADCRHFTPPLGTQALCEDTPLAQRTLNSPDSYMYSPASPAQRLLGPPYEISKDPYAMRRLLEFSESAIAGEPLEYLHAVWLDTIRLFDPGAKSFGSLSADGFIVGSLIKGYDGHGHNPFVTYWQNLFYPHDGPEHRGDIGALTEWEKLTRVTGVAMALLLILLVASPWVVPPPVRAVALLFAMVSLVLLFAPILTHGYDYRYTIPAFGPMFAGGGMAAWGLWLRTQARRRRPRVPRLSTEGPA